MWHNNFSKIELKSIYFICDKYLEVTVDWQRTVMHNVYAFFSFFSPRKKVEKTSIRCVIVRCAIYYCATLRSRKMKNQVFTLHDLYIVHTIIVPSQFGRRILGSFLSTPNIHHSKLNYLLLQWKYKKNIYKRYSFSKTFFNFISTRKDNKGV